MATDNTQTKWTTLVSLRIETPLYLAMKRIGRRFTLVKLLQLPFNGCKTIEDYETRIREIVRQYAPFYERYLDD